ncbi:peptidoglycan DD-metalloendopeptidase family protein [Sphingomonas sp.]|uniref:peptidoglycan DD-metalloendopeptidase family protein n=1 Tax=Sphingomonas sp. TaxID=28214 RepID=UPI003B005CF0
MADARRILPLALLLLAGCIPQVGAPNGYGGDAPPPPPDVETRPLPVEAVGAEDGQVRAVDVPSAVRQPAPAWVARKVVPDARTVPASTVSVEPGDTLSQIGERTGVGAQAIARANDLDPSAPLRTGQTLKVPGGRYHLVHQGESGVAIARAYGVSWSEVATLNDLQPPYLLRAGQRVLLPSAAQVASMSMEDRARAFQLDIDDLVTGSEPALARNAAPAKPSVSSKKPVPSAVAVAPPAHFAGRFDWPLTGRLISRFGPSGGGRRNDGINIAATAGAPVRAAADGVVAYAGSAIAVYGGLVLIRHGEGWITAYGHADQILVARGQSVKRGDVIARAGATGSVNTPQLHFEIRDKRTPVDPLKFLPDRD